METSLGMAKAAAEKTRLRVNTTAEERGEWVQLFESSGKSAPEFCRELGLAESTFAVWRRQVRGESAESCTFTEVPPPMVEAALAGNAMPVQIRLANGTELKVPAGTESTWLAQLLAALR